MMLFPDGAGHPGREDPNGRPTSVCLLCPVPEGEREHSFLQKAVSEIRKTDPALLRLEILWIASGTISPPDLFPELSSTLLRPAPEFEEVLPAVQAFLKSRSFDLVDPRFLELRLCRALQKLEESSVPGPPLDPEGEGAPLSPGFYRTLIRNRKLAEGRKGISFLRKTAGTVFSKKSPSPGTLRILMFHRVVDTLEPDILAVTPFAFAQQMAWLREEGWQVLPLKEALIRLEKGSLPERAAAITFDDGYRDNYEEAFPILSRFGFPATVFPVTGFVLGESEHRRYRGRTPSVPYLTPSHVREMKSGGIDFGGHTHTHPLLPTLSPEAAHDEIMKAKKLLEEWTGEESTLFAYPNGAYRKEHFRILNDLGYEAAFSVRPGANRRETLRWEIRRTEVSGRDSLGDFIQKMNGGLDLWHGLYQTVRGFYR